MKIKLKENSSVEILNQDGETIVKVNEDGTVSGNLPFNKTWYFDDFIDGDISDFDTEDLKIGDVIFDGAMALTGIVSELSRQSGEIFNLELFCIERGMPPCWYHYLNGQWTKKQISTQLYRHYITTESNNEFMFVNSVAAPYDKITREEVANNWVFQLRTLGLWAYDDTDGPMGRVIHLVASQDHFNCKIQLESDGTIYTSTFSYEDVREDRVVPL